MDETKRNQNCVDCGIESPATETNYTLISARYGWRLTAELDDSGQRVTKWRCPECWQRYKKAGPK